MASGNNSSKVKSFTYSKNPGNQQRRPNERRRQFMPRKRTSESENDGTCDLCVQSVKVYAVGHCDHPICHRCSGKMRILCEQNHCAVCRVEMKKVLYSKSRRVFEELNAMRLLKHRRDNIFFTDDAVKYEYESLFEHCCPVCPDHHTETSFDKLEAHVRRDHKLFYCNLCVRHNTNFTDECKTYTREGLAKHRRVGDEDDTSHKGHPLCEFCDERYLDNDALLQHLRKDHYFCHFCDQQGRNQYYDGYVDLRDHYRREHHLCEEGDCVNEKFTSVFASELDLKAHRAAAHSQGLSRQQQKVERNIDLGFQYVRPARRGRGSRVDRGDDGRGRGRGRGRGDNERDEDLELAKALSLAEMENSKKMPSNNKTRVFRVEKEQPKPQPVEEEIALPDLINDFPTLGGATEPQSQTDQTSMARKVVAKPVEKPTMDKPPQETAASKIASAAGCSVGRITKEDFPTLGSGNKPGAAQPTGIWGSSSNAGAQASAARNKSARKPKTPQPVSVNVPQSKVSKSNVNFKNVDDFPTLSGAGNSAVKQPQLTGAGIWGPFTSSTTVSSSRKSKKPKTPVVSQPTALAKHPAQPKIIPPKSVPHGFDPSPVSNDEMVSIRIGSHKHKMKLTSAKHYEEITDIEKPVEVPGVGGSTVATVSADTFSMLANKSASSGRQNAVVTESKFTSQGEDFPELGGAGGTRIKGIGGSKWGQKTSEKGAKQKKISLSDLSRDIASNGAANTESIFPSAEDDFPQITKPPPLSSYASNWNDDFNGISVADSIIKQRSFQAQESDFPSLSNSGPRAPQNGGRKGKKKKKKSQQTIQDLSKHFGGVAVNDSRNQGHLDNLLSEKNSQKSLSNILDTGDMFTPAVTDQNMDENGNTSGEAKEEALQTESNDDMSELDERPNEDDTEGRNIWLITTIQQLCGSEENFSEFKTASGAFRQGNMSANLYYNKCKILLGNKHFGVVFRELVDLLPDSDKQASLMEIHGSL